MKVGNRMKGGRREDRVNARIEKMVAKINKLEAENKQLKSDLMHIMRERSFQWKLLIE